MNSHFIQINNKLLNEIGSQIKTMADKLNPIYISDHIGKFYSKNGNPLISMIEIDYSTDFDLCCSKIYNWKKILECNIFFENFPSIIKQEKSQVSFYKRIIHETDCGLLFDISNANIAEKNTGENAINWYEIIMNQYKKHFHIGGYSKTKFPPFFYVDTHDNYVSYSSKSLLKKFLKNINDVTITVERDNNFVSENWFQDILDIINF